MANFNHVNARCSYAIRDNRCAFIKVNNGVNSGVFLFNVGVVKGRTANQAVGGRSISVKLYNGENRVVFFNLFVLAARDFFAFKANGRQVFARNNR